MKNNRLVIVDADRAYLENLVSHLRRHSDLNIVGTANDGIGARALIQSAHPDLVLMNPLLPGLDGMCLMKYMQQKKCPPLIICQLECCTPSTLEAMRRNGADYCIFKTMDLESVTIVLNEYADIAREDKHAKQLRESLNSADADRQRIHESMRALGFSQRYCGCEYIAESVLLATVSPMLLHNLTTGLYPELAVRFRISPASIERNIRTAIAAANVDGHLSACIGSTPTNKTCIQYILRQVNLQR